MVRFGKDWVNDLDIVQQEMDRLLGHLSSRKPPSVRFSLQAWEPAVDICETDDSILVLVELAGMQEDEIKVAAEKDALVISGERKDINQGIKRSFSQMEVFWGPFEKRIPLPFEVDMEQATASYHAGLLQVVIPKT